MKELTQDQKDLLEKINKCCIEIAKKNNYNIKSISQLKRSVIIFSIN